MLEQRPLVLGEQMSERHCRLAGFIGQVAVMANVGAFYESRRLEPSNSLHVTKLRSICRELAAGKFLDIETKFLAGNDNILTDVGNKIGFIRSTDNSRAVLDGNARIALEYHGRQTDIKIPNEFTLPFNDLVSYYSDMTRERIEQVAVITHDAMDNESTHIAKAGQEIAYYSKYLEPSL